MVRKGKNRERQGDRGERSRRSTLMEGNMEGKRRWKRTPREHSDGGGKRRVKTYLCWKSQAGAANVSFYFEPHKGPVDTLILDHPWDHQMEYHYAGRTSHRYSHKDRSRMTSRRRIQKNSLYTLTPHAHSHSHSHSQPHSNPLRWPSARPHAWQTQSSPRGSP